MTIKATIVAVVGAVVFGLVFGVGRLLPNRWYVASPP